MAKDSIVAGKNTLDYTSVNGVDVNLSKASTPLPPDPGLLSHVKAFFGNIFGDFYNNFRLMGYIAEIYYSGLKRMLMKWGLKEPHGFDNEPVFNSDWKSQPRTAINIAEGLVFMGTALIALFHDQKKFHNEVGAVVAAEQGKDENAVKLKDISRSNNPILQTATNRSKGLYLLRFLQPFTFLWSLKLGMTTTVFEIVAERAAYFEKNSYDQLQKLVKEVNINQQGIWSKAGITDRLVEIIQQNRAEHKALPVRAQDIEAYLPLLGKISDRLIERKWHFAETLYVLGQLIKEPQLPGKMQKAYDDIERYGLANIARMKLASAQQPAIPAPKPVVGLSEETPAITGNFASKLSERSPARMHAPPIGSYVEKTASQSETAAAAGIA